jgi:ribokinase
MIEVIGFGAMNVDHLYLVERILTDGEAPIEGQTISPGGSAANTIYGLAKLGIETGFIGAVGDDAEGQMLLDDFQNAGVDIGGIKIKRDAKTGSALCLTDKQGKRALYVSPGANSLLDWEDIDLKCLNQARLIHLSSFVNDKQLQLQQELLNALAPSVMVSLSPGEIYATKGLNVLAPLIKRAHILFSNQHEMEALTGEKFEPGTRRCLEQGCDIVVVTSGEEPFMCYVNDGGRGCYLEPPRDTEQLVVDTTGAGDAFAAGFLYGALTGKNLTECSYLGNIMARFCIAKIGARSGLPSQAQLRQEYERFKLQP